MKKYFFLLLFLAYNMYGQKELPIVGLKNLDGKIVATSDLNEADKLYVYSFWATWCGPCLNELEAINEVYTDWKNEINVELVAVSIDDSRTVRRVKPLVNGKNWPYTVLLDSNQDLKRALSIVDVPYTLIVKNGKVLHIQSGYMQGAEKELFELLKSYK